MAHFLTPLLRGAREPLALVVDGRSAPLATTLETAFDSTTRKHGLLGRGSLDAKAALIIAPSSAIHTFGMRFPIDVIYCARDGRILKLRANIVPGRISAALRAFAVIEMAVGSIERHQLQRGQVLSIREP